MIAKLATIWPEIAMAVGACLCLVMGLSASPTLRRLTAWVAALALAVAGYIVVDEVCSSQAFADEGSGLRAFIAGLTMADFIKLAVVSVGMLMLMVMAAVPDSLRQIREAEIAPGKFEPGLSFRGEFFAFFLLSLTGVMLTAGASDLVWLFLALELTSLPTYVMVATSRDRVWAQEAAVKYFFLGALAAAIFLYGFTLIYGATGFTDLPHIRQAVIAQVRSGAGVSPLMLAGLLISLVGVAFKIAAVPMHFYAADVYQGAATPVTAFLAFVPKTAGFVAMILLLSTVRGAGPAPDAVIWLLWVMAALTMTVGNVLGLMQKSVKRVLAYSSIAHSGYMLVGLTAAASVRSGVDGALPASALGDGVAGVLFYLVAYGLATLGAFAVLACLRARGEEVEDFDDLAGLAKRYPGLAAIMLLSVLSLLGLPPLVGFLGKIYLFGSAIQAGFVGLVIIAVLNSAISAVYYLRIAAACFFGESQEQTQAVPSRARVTGAAIAAVAALALGPAAGPLVNAAMRASHATDAGAGPRLTESPPALPPTPADAPALSQRD